VQASSSKTQVKKVVTCASFIDKFGLLDVNESLAKISVAAVKGKWKKFR